MSITRNETLKKILKNKKIILLVVIAFLLYGASFLTAEKTEKTDEVHNDVKYIDERKLEKILSNIKGAGNVEVYITYENSGVKNIAYDCKNTENSNEIQIKTVGKNNYEEPYVLSNTNPEIAGILVTATGANTGEKRAVLRKYVKAATNVSLNKIEVAQGEK